MSDNRGMPWRTLVGEYERKLGGAHVDTCLVLTLSLAYKPERKKNSSLSSGNCYGFKKLHLQGELTSSSTRRKVFLIHALIHFCTEAFINECIHSHIYSPPTHPSPRPSYYPTSPSITIPICLPIYPPRPVSIHLPINPSSIHLFTSHPPIHSPISFYHLLVLEP